MIRVENLAVNFDDQAIIDGLSFHLAKGEKLAVTGPSGSGKSTLLHSLMGFIPGYSGNIRINGQLLNDQGLSQIRKQVAWLPQELKINIDTVKELFYTVFSFHYNKKIKLQKTEIIEGMEALGVHPLKYNSYLNDLSGGERQRILLLSCLLLKRPLLLLDEPTAALDKRSVHKMIDFVFAHKDITVVSVTHSDMLLNRSDRIIEFNEK